MKDIPSEFRLLENTQVKRGEKWIFIADFNIKHDGFTLKGTDRVDAEIEDLKQILRSGGIAAILAHKGRFKDNDAEDLDYVRPYLAKALGMEVKYHPENTTPEAVEFVRGLAPGTAAIMGNTRRHEGEEKNSADLAALFARLGERVAVGGFGKAHRAHASNVGILKFLPGYLPRSQAREMRLLGDWAGRDEGTYSLAVLGGIKKEKITIGLVGFARIYDAVIPGGIVLNTALKVRGIPVGQSVLTDEGKSFEKEVAAILDSDLGGKLLLPEGVVVARRMGTEFRDVTYVDLRKGTVPADAMIVTYSLSAAARATLDALAVRKGRMVVAGTPDLYALGFGLATAEVIGTLKTPGVRGVVLGGETAQEVKFCGSSSTGGGSALHYVCYGSTAVFDALKANRQTFPG